MENAFARLAGSHPADEGGSSLPDSYTKTSPFRPDHDRILADRIRRARANREKEQVDGRALRDAVPGPVCLVVDPGRPHSEDPPHDAERVIAASLAEIVASGLSDDADDVHILRLDQRRNGGVRVSTRRGTFSAIPEIIPPEMCFHGGSTWRGDMTRDEIDAPLMAVNGRGETIRADRAAIVVSSRALCAGDDDCPVDGIRARDAVTLMIGLSGKLERRPFPTDSRWRRGARREVAERFWLMNLARNAAPLIGSAVLEAERVTGVTLAEALGKTRWPGLPGMNAVQALMEWDLNRRNGEPLRLVDYGNDQFAFWVETSVQKSGPSDFWRALLNGLHPRSHDRHYRERLDRWFSEWPDSRPDMERWIRTWSGRNRNFQKARNARVTDGGETLRTVRIALSEAGGPLTAAALTWVMTRPDPAADRSAAARAVDEALRALAARGLAGRAGRDAFGRDLWWGFARSGVETPPHPEGSLPALARTAFRIDPLIPLEERARAVRAPRPAPGSGLIGLFAEEARDLIDSGHDAATCVETLRRSAALRFRGAADLAAIDGWEADLDEIVGARDLGRRMIGSALTAGETLARSVTDGAVAIGVAEALLRMAGYAPGDGPCPRALTERLRSDPVTG